ncbi:MAG: zf-HC2 domain-containing protein [Elusimicrobia bacterium]|nr:zf-HC2 domain-containing protein [Elusimicrobiota bacterium]
MPAKDCENISRRLSAYMDGELPEREREAAESHLASCAACSEELASLRAASAAVSALPRVEPPPFFAARTAAAAKALNGAGPLRAFLRFPLPAAAVLTAFIIFNIFAFARDIDAMENGQRRELTHKVVSQLVRPSTLINPVAVARLCSECTDFMCQCMHEAGKQSICPCKNCRMHRENPDRAGEVPAHALEEDHVN